MTYRRPEGSFASAVTVAVRNLGEAVAAGVLGVSGSRVRQLQNPMLPSLRLLEQAVALDLASAEAGYGTPIYDAYRDQLEAAGALSPSPATQTLRNTLNRLGRELLALAEPPAVSVALVRGAGR